MMLSARQILEKLISFPTVSDTSNLDLIEYVETYLTELGVASVRVPNDEGNKANLYAHIGPQVEGGVVLCGHTDVVPVVGQDWDSDPFTLTERSEKLYGRGACDMKGFNALALAAVPDMLKANLKRPIQIALSYDEEPGCFGAPPLVEHMRANGMPLANRVIVGEPTMMKSVTGHKGGIGYKVHFRGHEVHSSIMHKGVNAIMMAAKFIDWCNLENTKNAVAKPNEIARFFDPHYSTIHTGTISGGTASNITAKDCYFDLDVRLLPGEAPEYWLQLFEDKFAELDTEMKEVHPDAGVHFERDFALSAYAPEEDGKAEALSRLFTGDNSTNMVSFITEAGIFQQAGYSTVVCGPGNIEQAHQPNEFISLDQFRQGEIFIQKLIKNLSE